MQRQIPMKAALEMALTGEPVSAARAAELGLVNRIAPLGNAVEVALGLAALIAGNAPVAVRESKRVVHRTNAAGSDWDDAVWKISGEAARVVFRSRDAREGTRAFAEKGLPEWEGR